MREGWGGGGGARLNCGLYGYVTRLTWVKVWIFRPIWSGKRIGLHKEYVDHECFQFLFCFKNSVVDRHFTDSQTSE